LISAAVSSFTPSRGTKRHFTGCSASFASMKFECVDAEVSRLLAARRRGMVTGEIVEGHGIRVVGEIGLEFLRVGLAGLGVRLRGDDRVVEGARGACVEEHARWAKPWSARSAHPDRATSAEKRESDLFHRSPGQQEAVSSTAVRDFARAQVNAVMNESATRRKQMGCNWRLLAVSQHPIVLVRCGPHMPTFIDELPPSGDSEPRSQSSFPTCISSNDG
jgi:hypothetical protein